MKCRPCQLSRAIMKIRLIITGAAIVAVVALAGGGAYVYFFSGLRSSPSALGLSATPSPSAPGSPIPSGSLAGNWTVTTGSVAGYRVKELFVGQTSKHEAVARTSTVSGSLTVSGDSTAYLVSDVAITVGL